eukprot:scaffold660918_cov59-Prasinocladus_malaysianus.AAC.2
MTSTPSCDRNFRVLHEKKWNQNSAAPRCTRHYAQLNTQFCGRGHRTARGLGLVQIAKRVVLPYSLPLLVPLSNHCNCQTVT